MWVNLDSFEKAFKELKVKAQKATHGDVVSATNVVKVGNSDFTKPLEGIVLDDNTIFMQFSKVDTTGAWYTEVLRKFTVHTTERAPSSKELKATMREMDMTSAEAIEALKQFKASKKVSAKK